MAEVVLMGGPKHGAIIEMGKGWTSGSWVPPSFRVAEYWRERHPITGREVGPGYMTIVMYPFYRKVGERLVYKRPGYRVGSL